MKRRTFLQAAALASAASAAERQDLPIYHVVTRYKPAAQPGMPGPYPGRVVSVHSEKCIDARTEKVDVPTVREMISRGMSALTGVSDSRDAWAKFFNSSDVVGIKVNCSGAPGIMTTPEVVADIVRNLQQVGVKPEQIYIYERFLSQMRSVHYETYLPPKVNVQAIEVPRGSIINYDPNTYVEVDFFGEQDTRSNMVRLVPDRFTKIINVPNMKDHAAAGVTGCLKNIAYGDFSNVARSHFKEKTNTFSFIGTLASVEPLRSRTVLQVMDGLRGVWQGGPFSRDRRHRYYPKRMMFGTDPVSIDRFLLDIIDEKRKAEHLQSVWVRKLGEGDHFIREPGHIEFASRLGLGIYDIRKIHKVDIEI